MSVLNSHRSAVNSALPIAAPKSMLDGIDDRRALRLSSVATVASRIASTVAGSRDGSYVVRVPDADPGALERVLVEELRVVR